MKTVKLKKNYKSLESFYNHIKKSVDKLDIAVYDVFVSKKDGNRLKEGLIKQAKKLYPYLNKIKIKSAIEWHWLCYGPNTTAEKAILSGYALYKDK